jgi:hypothetical protein
MNWDQAREKCAQNNMRIFEMNSIEEENSMFQYLTIFASENQFFWINGVAFDSRISHWFTVDPNGIWNYSSINWYGLVKAPVPGFCLGIILVQKKGKFSAKPCGSFEATFWCEYS